MLRELTIEEMGLVAGGDDMGGGFGDAFGDNGGSYSKDADGFGPGTTTNNGDGVTKFICPEGEYGHAIFDNNGTAMFCGPQN